MLCIIISPFGYLCEWMIPPIMVDLNSRNKVVLIRITFQGFSTKLFRGAKPPMFLGRDKVLEGLRREFERYERALCSNDVKEQCQHIASVS